MTRRLGLIVADASPLITLAAGDALDCLTMQGLRVVIPDVVYFEVTQDLARTGAADIRARRFVGALPERVMTLSTGDLLRELEAAGRIQSADHVLDVAVAHERNVEAQRALRSEDDARALLRQHLQSGSDGPAN